MLLWLSLLLSLTWPLSSSQLVYPGQPVTPYTGLTFLLPSARVICSACK